MSEPNEEDVVDWSVLYFKVNNPIDTDPDPSPKPGATKLRRYWTRGKGALKIRWGTPGDFNRCVRQLRKYVSDPKGLCNVYHRVAVGAPPGKGHKSIEEELDFDLLSEFVDFKVENGQVEVVEHKDGLNLSPQIVFGIVNTYDPFEEKRDIPADVREQMGKRGHAFKNHNGEWSYPIGNVEDLKNAIRAYGRAADEDKERLKKYIERRARELGHSELIPDAWEKKSEFDFAMLELQLLAKCLVELEENDNNSGLEES